MLKRLRSFLSFPAGEQWFAVRALGTLVLVRLALWLLPFHMLRAVVERLSRAPRSDPRPAVARAVRRAIDRAARTIPGTACLARALTAEVLLRRAGQPARLSIGVAPDGAPLDAHAWVECVGVLVTGDRDDLGRYRTLAVFSADAPTGAPTGGAP